MIILKIILVVLAVIGLLFWLGVATFFWGIPGFIGYIVVLSFMYQLENWANKMKDIERASLLNR